MVDTLRVAQTDPVCPAKSGALSLSPSPCVILRKEAATNRKNRITLSPLAPNLQDKAKVPHIDQRVLRSSFDYVAGKPGLDVLCIGSKEEGFCRGYRSKRVPCRFEGLGFRV